MSGGHGQMMQWAPGYKLSFSWGEVGVGKPGEIVLGKNMESQEVLGKIRTDSNE